MRLHVEAINVLGEPEHHAVVAVSRDDGATYQALAVDDIADGFPLQPGRLRLRVSRIGFHPVEQGLVIEADRMVKAPPHDPRALLQLIGARGAISPRRYKLGAWLLKFKRAKRGWKPMGRFDHDLWHFDGHEVLGTGTGQDRLNAHVHLKVEEVDASKGHVEFLEADASARSPKLVAVWVPKGIDLSAPVATHTYFMPTPRIGKEVPYPGDEEYRDLGEWAMVEWYPLLHQHTLVSRITDTLFIVPVPGRVGFYDGVAKGKDFERFLLEICATLSNLDFYGPMPAPKLGIAAISGFSAGGAALVNLVRNTSRKGVFDLLREVYSLDAQQLNAKAVARMGKKWLGAVAGRKLRLYVTYEKAVGPEFRPSFVSGPPTRTSAGAMEWSDPNAKTFTYLYAPPSFWQAVADEAPSNQPTPHILSANSGHSATPRIFMNHALRISDLR